MQRTATRSPHAVSGPGYAVLLAGLAVALVLSVAFAIGTGTVEVPVGRVIGIIWGHLSGDTAGLDPLNDQIVWDFRTPRVLLAALGPQALDGYLAAAELPELTPKTITAPDALRAALSRVASQGYALVDQELEVGLRSIAVPVRARGRVVAALNVSMHASRGSSEAARRELLPPLRATAEAIESDLAATPLP